MLHIFQTKAWNPSFSELIRQQAIDHLENGSILYFPHLTFNLDTHEKFLLSPDFADPHAKNISYQKDRNKLWGVQHLTDHQHAQLKHMLERFCIYSYDLIKALLPSYIDQLIIARTSFRPVQISGRKTSCRKDDKRLHIDAFPSAPNQGKRILRIFCNINPHGEDRIWRVGESFKEVATQFLPKCSTPLYGKASLLRFLKITKSYRSLYDHYMLQLHDRMKIDETYQRTARQQEIRFNPGSTWIVQTDDVSHAAMKGQYLLEQTFYLPIHGMKNEAKSPLRILEKMLNRPLV